MTRFTGGFPPDPDAPAPLPPPTAAGADAGPGLPISTLAAPAPALSSPPSPEDSIPGDRNPRFANPAATNQTNTTQHHPEKNLPTRRGGNFLDDAQMGRGKAEPDATPVRCAARSAPRTPTIVAGSSTRRTKSVDASRRKSGP
uniref:Uncharacterized protein n=1 Tax=Arundo donax TaxID=35708 RepID=A0A0A9DF94_ARUDO